MLDLLTVAATLGSLLSRPALSALAEGAPNVLVFVIDDIEFTNDWIESAPLGTELEGSHSIKYKNYPTDRINEFRESAVVFPKSYCGAPKCSPSRFSLLTGRQPTRGEYAIQETLNAPEIQVYSEGALNSGIYGPEVSVLGSRITGNDGIYNVPYTLREAGYYTGTVGKWHLMSETDNGRNIGCEILEDSPNATLYDACRDIVKEQGFDFIDAWYFGNIVDGNQYFSHNPEWMVSQSQKFIKEAQANEQPFFLYFASTLTHAPDVKLALTEFTYLDSPKGQLTGDDIPDDTSMMSRADIWALTESQHLARESQITEWATYHWVDASFGALIDFLDAEGLYDNTFIVLQNDHGQQAKGMIYEQGSRIMNFVRYPMRWDVIDGPAIMPDDFVVSNTDLAATLFDLAGITPPAEYVLDGKSWLNDVEFELTEHDHETPGEQTCCVYKYIDTLNSHSIVTGAYQYLFRANLNVETGHGVDELYRNTYDVEQLYDLVNDPNERDNLIEQYSHDAELAQTIEWFRSMMIDYIESICVTADEGDESFVSNSCIMPNVGPPTTTTSPPPSSSTTSTTPAPIVTTTEQAGCCKGLDKKYATMCAPKDDADTCGRSDTKCVWLVTEDDKDCEFTTTTKEAEATGRADGYASAGDRWSSGGSSSKSSGSSGRGGTSGGASGRGGGVMEAEDVVVNGDVRMENGVMSESVKMYVVLVLVVAAVAMWALRSCVGCEGKKNVEARTQSYGATL